MLYYCYISQCFSIAKLVQKTNTLPICIMYIRIMCVLKDYLLPMCYRMRMVSPLDRKRFSCRMQMALTTRRAASSSAHSVKAMTTCDEAADVGLEMEWLRHPATVVKARRLGVLSWAAPGRASPPAGHSASGTWRNTMPKHFGFHEPVSI